LKDEFIAVKFSYLFSFGRKRNKTPERHYSWSIYDLIAKSNKLAFSKLKQHLILRYFHRINAHSVVNAQFWIVMNIIIGFLIENEID